MFDHQGRVWITATVRPSENPDVFKSGSSHPSAQRFPLNSSGRQLGMYDPKRFERATAPGPKYDDQGEGASLIGVRIA